MARFTLSNITNLLFSFITFSSIIFNKQEQYDRITARDQWNLYYDYVIVGGGTAGSVLAARLSEDPTISVLVLEAGASETVSSNTPGLCDSLLGTIIDWKFVSTPQNYSCLGMNDARCFLSSGRVIGGTSSINRLYYLRGNPNDYNSWQQKFELKSWSWNDVFPFFARNENQTDPDRIRNGYFGLNGPIKLDKNENYNSILEGFVFSSKMSGYPNVDLNSGMSSGTSILQSTIDGGRRISTSTAFLEPNLHRPNLHIISNSYALNVVFDGNQAIGVKFYRNWKSNIVYAKQEVILSAGTINTAKLLMLSGVGPRAELDRFKISLVSDLPVGENFHDHVGSNGLHFTVDMPEPLVTKYNLKQYFSSGKGPLAENRYAATVWKSFDSMSVVKNNHGHVLEEDPGSKSLDIPNLMLLAFENSLSSKEFTSEMVEQRTNLRKDVWNSYYSAGKGKGQFSILPIVLTPKSRGTVRLNSNNPLDIPVVDPGYLTHEADIRMLVEGMRETLRIAKSQSFKSFNTQLYSTIVPGCEVYAPKAANNQAKSIALHAESLPTTTTTTTMVAPSINATNKPNHLETTTTSTNKTKISILGSGIFKRFSFFNKKRTNVQPKQPLLKTTKRTSKHRVFTMINKTKQSPIRQNVTELSWLDYFGNGKTSPHHSNPNQYNKYQLIDGFSSVLTDVNVPNEEFYKPSRSDTVPTTTTMRTTEVPIRSSTITTSSSSKTTTTADFKNQRYHQNPIYYGDPNYWNNSGSINETTLVVEESDPEALPPPPSLSPPNQSTLEISFSDQFTDDYLQCMARMLTMPIGDYVGTARMGPDGDRRRVVDPEFRVIGVDRLRVIDASVIPEIVTGSIGPVAMMIGERGALFIKDNLMKNGKRN